jgi:hypothetical protein
MVGQALAWTTDEQKHTVIRKRKTFEECKRRGERTQLAGQRMAKASKLNGGW